MGEITRDMTLREVLNIKPAAVKIFEKWNIPCSGCPVASMETVEQGAMLHGINVDQLVEELNAE